MEVSAAPEGDAATACCAVVAPGSALAWPGAVVRIVSGETALLLRVATAAFSGGGAPASPGTVQAQAQAQFSPSKTETLVLPSPRGVFSSPQRPAAGAVQAGAGTLALDRAARAMLQVHVGETVAVAPEPRAYALPIWAAVTVRPVEADDAAQHALPAAVAARVLHGKVVPARGRVLLPAETGQWLLHECECCGPDDAEFGRVASSTAVTVLPMDAISAAGGHAAPAPLPLALVDPLVAAMRAPLRVVHVLGASGLGKTVCVRAAALAAGRRLVPYDPLAAPAGSSPALALAARAFDLRPSVLLCDDADLHFPADSQQPDEESALEAHRLAAAVRAWPASADVTVVLVSRQRADVAACLRLLAATSIEAEPPNDMLRAQLLQHWLAQTPPPEWVHATAGLTGAELQALCHTARAAGAGPVAVRFAEVLARRHVHSAASAAWARPATKFDALVGLAAVKQNLADAVGLFLRDPAAYALVCRDFPRGILLYGPTGR